MIGAAERVAHVAECRPEICTLDCGTMNFAEADYVMTNTPGMLRAMGAMMTDLGVKPEIEAFDTGHLWFAKQLVRRGCAESPALVQLCMGVPWGAPNDLNTFMAMVNNVPEDWHGRPFAGARPDAYVAAAVLAGGNVRSGWRTICSSTKGFWRPTRNWSSAPWHHRKHGRAGRWARRRCARPAGPDKTRARLGSRTMTAPRAQPPSSAVG
jgi:uncharacterized protein (DUF849 family)